MLVPTQIITGPIKIEEHRTEERNSYLLVLAVLGNPLDLVIFAFYLLFYEFVSLLRCAKLHTTRGGKMLK
jgi:hypothetical protein